MDDSSDWALLEVIDQEERRPCSDEYAEGASKHELKVIFKELRLLLAAGCPPDKTLGNPEIEPALDCLDVGASDPKIWVLKAKPSLWRLYFCVLDRRKRRLLFLFSSTRKVKGNKRDPRDPKRACTILGQFHTGVYKAIELEVPPR